MQHKAAGVLFYIAVALFFLFTVKFLLGYGPFYSSDTVDYLRMAKVVSDGFFPHSPAFSPGFPFLLGFTSNIFGLSQLNSIFIWVFVFMALSVAITYRIVKLSFDNEGFTLQKGVFFTFIFLSHWAILKILLSAHADAFFLVTLLIYFYLLLLWLKTFEVKWLVLISLLAGACIWVKYNGLILIPFLILASLFFGRNRFKTYLLVIPVAAGVTSYLLFKAVNGTVISHLQGSSFYEKLEFSLHNYELLYSNLVLSGRVFFGTLFSSSLQLLMPEVIIIGFLILLVIFSSAILVARSRQKTVEDVFLYFSFFYWLVFLALNQYAAYHEINSRTMFPSIISFVLWLLLVLRTVKIPILAYAGVGVLLLNLAYSFYYVDSLNRKTDEKNTLNYMAEFQSRKSILELKKLQKIYDFEDRVYSNEVRNASFALDFLKVKPFPSTTVFSGGSFVKRNEAEFGKLQAEFCRDFSKGNTAVVLFNYPKAKVLYDCFKTKQSKIYYIGKDVIIIN